LGLVARASASRELTLLMERRQTANLDIAGRESPDPAGGCAGADRQCGAVAGVDATSPPRARATATFGKRRRVVRPRRRVSGELRSTISDLSASYTLDFVRPQSRDAAGGGRKPRSATRSQQGGGRPHDAGERRRHAYFLVLDSQDRLRTAP